MRAEPIDIAEPGILFCKESWEKMELVSTNEPVNEVTDAANSSTLLLLSIN